MSNNLLPVHIGFIMDGNRRWAKNRGLNPLEGHYQGVETFKTVSKAAINSGVSVISAYVFSTENWNRAKEEIDYLMDLLYKLATTEISEANEKNIRIRFLGSRRRLSRKIIDAIDTAEAETATNTKGTIAFCLNYGGQLEIADAVQKMIEDGVTAREVTPEKIADYLYAADIPPVDMVVRTSGEQRLSNFMLWRVAYAELMFVEKHWPDFSEEDLKAVLEEYSSRHRRFGA